MKVIFGLLVLAALVVATVLAAETWPLYYVVPSAALVVVYLLGCIVNVQPKTAVVIVNPFGGMREARQGWQLVLRPFEWLGKINGAEVFSLQKRVLDVKLDVESEDEEVLTLDLSINFRIVALIKFLEFPEAEFKESLSEHAKALASERARLCKDRDEIMDKKADIEDFIHFGFQRRMFSGNLLLEEYHGIKVDTVVISDPELPEDLKKAEVEREIAEKRAEAKVHEAKGLARAAKALQGRTPKGQQPEMKREKAMELELIRSGAIKKENKEVEIGPHLAEAIDSLPKGVLAFFGSLFMPKGGKRKGKKKGGP
ncbi:MAG: hypothetical protein G01um10143_396 [Parcubacteria group bacterium Gr01-1014_3]|nr:MAG: hypothetical protein G01um10143_396 [Parcubacteria group bacterium Gr01-1014_3]